MSFRAHVLRTWNAIEGRSTMPTRRTKNIEQFASGAAAPNFESKVMNAQSAESVNLRADQWLPAHGPSRGPKRRMEGEVARFFHETCAGDPKLESGCSVLYASSTHDGVRSTNTGHYKT